RVEAGAGFPLHAPQTDYFGPGFAGRLNLGVGLGEWVGVQLTGQPLALPSRMGAPGEGTAVPIGLGGGVRVKMPYTHKVSPWIDLDLLYVLTGPLGRLGYTVGAGLHVPVGEQRIVRVGPFARFFQVIDSAEAHFDS